jgi:hypothetical protein
MSFQLSRGHKGVNLGALDSERLSFLDRRLPPGFVLRVVVIAPGEVRAYDAAEWRAALVMVEWGEIVLEPRHGDAYRFGRGDVLWLQGLALRALRNPGSEPAVLAAVARRAGAGPRGLRGHDLRA